MNIAFFSTKSYDRETFGSLAPTITYFEPSLREETMKLGEGYEAICVFVNDKLNATVIRHLAARGLKVIALRCAGFNNVDLDVARELNIPVVRVPAYSPEAVAEHALALIMALNRKTHKAYNRVREGNFSLERLTGFNLYEKKVGVIGTGNIGAAFARIMHAMGCQVLASDVVENPALPFVQYVSLPELLSVSDIISLHCPLMPATKYLISKENLEQMKDGVMLINTSRGGLIHTKDAIEALKTGKIGYLGIDVYEQEEQLFFRDWSEQIIQDDLISRLMSFPNVLITAHQAFLTQEALDQIARVTIQNLEDFEEGKELVNRVI